MSKLPKILALLALALGGCGSGASSQSAPLDRFTFPTGLALHTLGDGRRALVVVSSNFDLRYDPRDGGSVLVVDPDASSGDAIAVLGAQRIASFGGPPAIVSGRDETTTAAVDPTCQGWSAGDEILVASRGANTLYRIALADDGALSCGAGCAITLGADLVDPYAVTPACRTVAGSFVAEAYLTHFGAPAGQGFVTRLNLLSADSTHERLGFTASATQDVVWDPARRRLYVTGRFTTLNYAPLRWLDLAFPNAVLGAADLNLALRGADMRGIALAAPAPVTQFSTRAYVVARVFDQDLAATFGGRTPDVGGALMVLDITDDDSGRPRAQVLRIVPVGVGASQVHVLPGRPAGEELVVVTSEEGSVAIYDAARDSIVRILAFASADTVAPGPFQPPQAEDPAASPGPRDPGAYHAAERLFGKQPFAAASDLRADGRIRLYVSSFDRGFISEVIIDPAVPAAAQVTKRFGRRQP